MATLKLEHLCKDYGRVLAVNDLNLEVGDGEMLALLGESGCGKTTTLRMIAGFEEPTSGRVVVDGQELGADVPPYKRNIGIFFQNYALFPHMTVFENVAFGLKMQKVPKDEIRRRVDEALDMVRLPDLGNEMPRQLSGGQQQRIALARALVTRPRVLLLDEPLSNLDAKLRIEMQVEIKRIQSELGITTIIVTHDQEEAVSLAHRIAVMKSGEILQLGTPGEVFDHPNSPFIADFMGFTTFVRGTCSGSDDDCRTLICSGKQLLVDTAETEDIADGQQIVFAMRPESFVVGDDAGENAFEGVVEHCTYRGHTTQLEVSGIFEEHVFPSVPGQCAVREGESIVVGMPASGIRVFGNEG